MFWFLREGGKSGCSQRAGIADGGEFYIRPPGTAAWLLIKFNIKN
jgi:hypothetical protein